MNYTKYVPMKMSEKMYEELKEVADHSGDNVSETIRKAIGLYTALNRPNKTNNK